MPERMKLADKGLVAPPPQLEGPAGRVAEAIAAWPGVVAATHWRLGQANAVDGADFYVGEEELGHIHLDGEVHLATTPPLREVLVASGHARPFPWYPGWVEASIGDERDADHALWLFELNRRRIAGEPMAKLLAEIATRM